MALSGHGGSRAAARVAAEQQRASLAALFRPTGLPARLATNFDGCDALVLPLLPAASYDGRKAKETCGLTRPTALLCCERPEQGAVPCKVVFVPVSWQLSWSCESVTLHAMRASQQDLKPGKVAATRAVSASTGR